MSTNQQQRRRATLQPHPVLARLTPQVQSIVAGAARRDADKR